MNDLVENVELKEIYLLMVKIYIRINIDVNILKKKSRYGISKAKSLSNEHI